jgi:hypothetical protein
MFLKHVNALHGLLVVPVAKMSGSKSQDIRFCNGENYALKTKIGL